MTDSIANFNTFDAFADAGEGSKTSRGGRVHIRMQQRNGRKKWTIIEGLPDKLDFEKVVKVFKTQFCCNGVIIEDPNVGKVIQLQGSHHEGVIRFLVSEGICKKDAIEVHGTV